MGGRLFRDAPLFADRGQGIHENWITGENQTMRGKDLKSRALSVAAKVGLSRRCRRQHAASALK
jgi:hypothetical protein